jgi:HlyD family secretion protein
VKTRPKVVALAALVVICLAGAVIYRRQQAPPKQPAILGMARQTEIRIAPETSGRLTSAPVRPGQHVRKGELLAIVGNPDLEAALGEAQAAAASAAADRARVFSGVRAEEVAIDAQAVRTADANFRLAKENDVRTVTLVAKKFASLQQRDESAATLAKAQAELDAKRAEHAAASAGPTAEERALAQAKVVLAEATVAKLQAKLGETRLTAPTDGTVGIRVAEPGEIIAPGKPVMTLSVDGERYFAFTLREDMLHGLKVGGVTTVATADGRRIEARVTELRPLGEFAVWRAARAVGDHDLNSFRLRLDPTGESTGLEPGMSVWLPGAL